MIAEPPATAAPATPPGARRETTLSINRVAGQLQLILATRRAQRNAESASQHDTGNDM